MQYIDFASICDEYNLTSGDLSFDQQVELEKILEQFIKQNI